MGLVVMVLISVIDERGCEMQGARCGFDGCDGISVIGEDVKCRVRDVGSMAVMVFLWSVKM